MTKATLGEQVDSRGIDLKLSEDDIITDIVVLAECVSPDGKKYLHLAKDEHVNWLKEIGMLTYALEMIKR
jgi:hypothetical protein